GQSPAQGPVRVERRSGGYRPGGPADVQVAAQALCLREMFGAAVPLGVIFAGKDRRRHEVVVDAALAERVRLATAHMRALYDADHLPAPVNDARCRRCSLRDGCMPEAPASLPELFLPRPAGDWHA